MEYTYTQRHRGQTHLLSKVPCEIRCGNINKTGKTQLLEKTKY